jgi:ferredoxin
MALLITEDCINCDVCEPVCPNQAIYQGESIYEIKNAFCTECVGHFNEPQCVAICPVNCIIKNPDCVESEAELQAKYHQLTLT